MINAAFSAASSPICSAYAEAITVNAARSILRRSKLRKRVSLLRLLQNRNTTWHYCRNFVIVLPLLILLFRYKKSQWEYEKNALIAVMSCYGVDIMQDNVNECVERLFNLFVDYYKSLLNV